MQADRELIEASRRGDRGAFAKIIERYQRAVYAVAFSGTRDRALADDVAQDAFVIAWRRLDELREAAKLPAWLCGIARNLARDARKRRARDTHDDADRAIDTTTPYDAISEAESERIVAAALGQVPDVYREPLVLFYYEERSVADVARSLGITAATTNKRLSRGRQFLAERVQTIFERGVTRRGVRATLAASVLALIAFPAAHVDASPVAKGSTMHKFAIAATVAATVTTGTVVVVATTTRGSSAQASTDESRNAGDGVADKAKHGASMHHPGARAASLPALLGATGHSHHQARTAAVTVQASDCAAVGKHLADLEVGTGQDPGEHCATDYASICESEGWSAERRACMVAADDLLNAHLCSSAASTSAPGEVIPPALACANVAAHIAPIVQGAGMYADVPDFAQQVESACDDGEWSVTLRQCFVDGQAISDLHACLQPTD
jgi:RNA polymerase sigma factor (sigma-70 family)